MRVSNISFRGYREEGTQSILLNDAKSEIEKARPYLKLIGDSLPYDKDLLVKANNTVLGDVFRVRLVDKKTGMASTILKKDEHDFIGNGFWLVGDTFKGLAKYSKEIFEETAKNFCLKFSNLEKDMDPKYKNFIKGIAETVTSPHDHCC